MKQLLFFAMICALCSCGAMKKTISQFSRKADSTGFFKNDSSRLTKKDSASTSIDLKDVAVDIWYQYPSDDVGIEKMPDTIVIGGDNMPSDGDLTLDDKGATQKNPKSPFDGFMKSFSGGLKPSHIRFTIGSVNYDHSHIISVDSITDVDTSSVKVISKQVEYHKDVERKGITIGGRILMIAVGTILLIAVVYFVYKKIKNKIPFI